MSDPEKHFANTILDIDGFGSVDLREPISAAIPLPFDRAPFGVITAYNPRSVLVPDEANRRADQALASRLTALRLPAIRATGRSPDRSHAEPGYAIAVPLEQLVALAKEFDQTAVFWWDGARFVIWPADV